MLTLEKLDECEKRADFWQNEHDKIVIRYQAIKILRDADQVVIFKQREKIEELEKITKNFNPDNGKESSPD